MSTIIVYAGGSNTTAVAEYIAKKMSAKAVAVASAGSEDLSSYDKVIIGTRVHAGKMPSEIVDYVDKNKDVIAQKDPAFFLCCMYNGDKGQKQVQKVAGQLGISKYAYFNKGKKIITTENNDVDKFIALL